MATRTTKPPRWILPVGAIVLIGGGFYILKKKKEKEEEPKATEVNPYLAQSFIPVTANNVAGVGAVSMGTGPSVGEGEALLNAQEENRKSIFEFLENKENRKSTERLAASERQGEREGLQFERDLRLQELTNNLTGGGAPVSNSNPGVIAVPPVVPTVAPPEPSAPPAQSPPAVGNGCPPEFPLFNPAPGKGCYRISRTKTGGGCECHGYKSGELECQTGSVKNGSCHWP